MKLTDKRILVTGADGFIGSGNEISVGHTLNLIKLLMHSDVTFIEEELLSDMQNA